jgi:hypothetical protein
MLAAIAATVLSTFATAASVFLICTGIENIHKGVDDTNDAFKEARTVSSWSDASDSFNQAAKQPATGTLEITGGVLLAALSLGIGILCCVYMIARYKQHGHTAAGNIRTNPQSPSQRASATPEQQASRLHSARTPQNGSTLV